MGVKVVDKVTLHIVGGYKREVTMQGYTDYFMYHIERGAEEVTSTPLETIASIDLGWDVQSN